MKLRSILIATIIACFTLALFTLQSEASDWTGIYARVTERHWDSTMVTMVTLFYRAHLSSWAASQKAMIQSASVE